MRHPVSLAQLDVFGKFCDDYRRKNPGCVSEDVSRAWAALPEPAGEPSPKGSPQDHESRAWNERFVGGMPVCRGYAPF